MPTESDKPETFADAQARSRVKLIVAALDADAQTQATLRELAEIFLADDTSEDDRRMTWYTIEEILLPAPAEPRKATHG